MKYCYRELEAQHCLPGTVIQRNLDPRFLSKVASYDVASRDCEAQESEYGRERRRGRRAIRVREHAAVVGGGGGVLRRGGRGGARGLHSSTFDGIRRVLSLKNGSG